jgi:hypothetical protein
MAEPHSTRRTQRSPVFFVTFVDFGILALTPWFAGRVMQDIKKSRGRLAFLLAVFVAPRSRRST